MPYITTEASEQEGSPVEVYEFFMANKRYLISSGGVRDQVTFNGFRCESLPISRGQVVYTSDNQKSALDVVIPDDVTFARDYITKGNSNSCTLNIHRFHASDNTQGNSVVYWKGRVLGARFDDNHITLQCESVFSSIARAGLRQQYTLYCRHALFSSPCRLIRDNFKYPATLAEPSTAFGVKLNGLPTNVLQDKPGLTGGVMDDGNDRYSILSHSGQNIVLDKPCKLNAGAAVTVYAGCNKTKEYCKDAMNNIENFGGFSWMPLRNISDGRPY